jgi:CMP/dCMP kinase
MHARLPVMPGTKPLIIAIDGPSGAGKGTIARTIARRLGYRHIDTGAMYRAVAWKALTEGLDLADAAAVARLARDAVFELEGRIAIDDADVTDLIRTPEIDEAAAIVARHPSVREVLVARQRQYGDQGGIVMEGRDIGSVVFPSADVKVYLDATPAERARRRAGDTAHALGRQRTATDAIETALAARDRSDLTRTASPLTIAPDAVYIDTTGIPIDDVTRWVEAIVERALARAHDAAAPSDRDRAR